MVATLFIDVLKSVEQQCRGEAFICSTNGDVVAAVEMADTETADGLSGTVQMVKAWNYRRPWAAGLNANGVIFAAGDSVLVGDTLVSVWPLDSPLTATASLGDSLRIVIAVPTDAYGDPIFLSLRYWFMMVCALPVAFILVGVFHNCWFRFIRKGSKALKDMTIEELAAVTKMQKEAIAAHKKAEKEKNAKAREETRSILANKPPGLRKSMSVASSGAFSVLSRMTTVGNLTRGPSMRDRLRRTQSSLGQWKSEGSAFGRLKSGLLRARSSILGIQDQGEDNNVQPSLEDNNSDYSSNDSSRRRGNAGAITDGDSGDDLQVQAYGGS
jgi:hypothetical protein